MRQATRLKQTLERQIVTGEIRPGERLEELDIAQRFGVSRTPVREALMMLEAIGLVDRRPRQGAVVRGMTLKTLVQMLEYFAALEGFAGRLAAKRLRDPEAEGLRAAQDACRQAAATGDADDYYNRNIAFHRAIYAASYNQVLIDQLEHFGQRLEPFLRSQHHQPGWIEKSVAEHDGIAMAILSGDGETADRLLRQHVNFDSQLFAEFASQAAAG
ncbi:GntR family transcriptional regulator [Luteithermobacter gelatinilyticus]|uniref:GntR family transcriptional regulator n=1 Tax=Luteithermobacter gelatinilyticus TaxID=2582913 RepID=UPI0011059EA1|nr:GntR family transcriptional regulator [Luteithermobacter gelatinilyticus]|tara:strand:- start:2154 stop:2798 length:645 start_codon:yes stop_codon:yes gene_type:complete